VEGGKLVTLALAMRKSTELGKPSTSDQPSGNITQKAPAETTRTVIPEVRTATTGTLVLEAVPTGEVKVDDGTFVNAGGGTRITVPAGMRTVTFRGKTGMTRETRIRVGAGGTEGIKCYFTGDVNVSTTNVDGKRVAGVITVDGVQTETWTPATISLPAGRYRIGVTKRGFELVGGERMVTIEPSLDGTTKVKVPFKMKEL